MSTEMRRVRLPEALDVDVLRGCVDAALRMIGEDAAVKYGPAMERHLGSDWTHDARFRKPGTAPISPHDPAFWLREMQDPGSPARMTPVLRMSSSSFNYRLAEAARARNAHYHFADAPTDTRVVYRRLVVLKQAADQLRLPCASELSQLADRVKVLQDGDLPPTPTLAEAAGLAERNAELIAEVQRLRADQAEKAEHLDRANDVVTDLSNQLSEASAAVGERGRLEAELRDARAHVERLRQEADIAAQHHRDAERHQAVVDSVQSHAPELPATVGEVLAHLYAAAIGAYRLVDAATPNLPGELHPEVLDLSSDLRAEYSVVLDELGVSRTHVDALPANLGATRAWVVDHGAAAQALALTASWDSELAALDPESRYTAERFLQMGGKCVSIADAAHRTLEEVMHSAPVGFQPGSPRQIEGGDQIPAGAPWPFDRGSDTWVLSATHREMRRPGRRVGRLRDQIGSEAESAVVDAFLRIRPEGGRVFVDDDGDASTFIDGELVYLGMIPTGLLLNDAAHQG